MITQTRENILTFIKSRGQARVHDLVQEFKISNVAVHKQIKKLLSENLIEKRGVPPVVFYVPKIEKSFETSKLNIEDKVSSIIEQNFLSITPDGKMYYGVEGFVYWASIYGKNKPIEELARDYAAKMKEKDAHLTPEGLVDATAKLKGAFPSTVISKLMYADIYSIPIFGRTKLAKLVMHAKGSQDEKLVSEIAEIIKNPLGRLLTKNKIEAVGYIPPTVPRPMQFMTALSRNLSISLPELNLVKVMPGSIPVPQKSLSSTNERVINARASIYPKSLKSLPYKNILLIDDVAGSGASFNETATKIANLNGEGNMNIFAFAIVGNIKGYDVVRQI
ncbi:MAG: hypothetical protein U0525_03475 [Patescibacteria group bacterium]